MEDEAIICPKCKTDISGDVHDVLQLNGPVATKCPKCGQSLQIKVKVEDETNEMEDMEKVVKLLNDAIGQCLDEPGGDPVNEQLICAADVFKALKLLGQTIDDEEGVEKELRGENAEGEDFLED